MSTPKFFLTVILLAVAFSFQSCSNNPNNASDSSADEIKFEKVRQEKSESYADLSLETFEFWKDGSKNNAFNDTLKAMVTRLKAPYMGEALEEKKKEVISLSKQEGFEAGDEKNKYQFKVKAVNGFNDPYVGVMFRIYEYSLGAHGSTYFVAKTYNLETNKDVTLGDYLNLETAEQRKALKQLISAKVQVEDFCEVPTLKGDFKNFIIGQSELVIGFGSYDFGAYSCGSWVVQIPLAELQKVGLLVSLV